MNRVLSGALLVATIASTSLLAAPAASAALPGESPADTYGVNGTVRAVVTVGDTIWLGGEFTAVTNGNSTAKVATAVGLAALSRSTGRIAMLADVPRLTGNVEVWALATDGDRVWAAGRFAYDGTNKKNLISFDGTTGGFVDTYTGVPLAKSVEVGDKVYVGGKTVSAWPLGGGGKLGGFTTSTLKESVGGHEKTAAMRSLHLHGDDLYGACQCSAVVQGGSSTGVNTLIRLSAANGALDKPFSTKVPSQVGTGSFGLDVTSDSTGVYLAAGGSDYVAKFNFDGTDRWHSDTSGSSQTLTLTSDGDELVVGGHFQWVEDGDTSQCGSNQNPNQNCARRLRLMAVNPSTGALLSWDPSVCCQYNGLWAATADGSSVHVGGTFTKVHNEQQTYYARLG